MQAARMLKPLSKGLCRKREIEHRLPIGHAKLP